MRNKKGFTLVELLAVIVILGILAGVAILTISNILVDTRKDAFVANARVAIDAARNDYLINNPTKFRWTLEELNELLEKDLVNTPFGGAYSSYSYVVRALDGDFGICLQGQDDEDGGIAHIAEKDLSKDAVVFVDVFCRNGVLEPPTSMEMWINPPIQ